MTFRAFLITLKGKVAILQNSNKVICCISEYLTINFHADISRYANLGKTPKYWPNK